MSERIVRKGGDYQRSLITQHVTGTKHVEHIRKEAQDMDPVIDRVRYLNEKVNNAPASGNRSQMRYIASVPVALLWDWLKRRGYQMDQYARNDEGRAGIGVRDEFMAEVMRNPDYKKFRAETHGHAVKRVFGG